MTDKSKPPQQANPTSKTIQDAIKIGQDLIKKEITKTEASMVMYRLLHEGGCDQEMIVDAFQAEVKMKAEKSKALSK